MKKIFLGYRHSKNYQLIRPLIGVGQEFFLCLIFGNVFFKIPEGKHISWKSIRVEENVQNSPSSLTQVKAPMDTANRI